MAKQKTIPELQAEIAVKERQIAQLQHKQQQLENRRSYYRKATVGSGRTILSPVGPPWRALLRWQRF